MPKHVVHISAIQLFSLALGVIFGTSTIVVTGLTAQESVWFSDLVAAGIGLIGVGLYLRLWRYHGDHTLIGYAQSILGPYLGKLLAAFYVFFFLYRGALVLRFMTEFIVITLLPQTPVQMIIGPMMLLTLYATRYGLETIARTATIITAAIMALLLTISLLLIPEYKTTGLLPLFSQGLPTVLLASIPIYGFPLSELVLFTIFLPNMNKRCQTARRALYSAVLVGMFFIILNDLETFMVLGPNMIQNANYPYLKVIRYISLGRLLDRIDPFIITIFVGGVFIKLTVYQLATTVSAAELLGVKNDQVLSIPLAIMTICLAILAVPNITELNAVVHTQPTTFNPLFGFVVPLILLGATWLRRTVSAAGQPAQADPS